MMTKFTSLLAAAATLSAVAILSTATAHAQAAGVQGYWLSPHGSVLHVAPCGPGICATIVAISKTAPKTTDGLNPDPKLRDRPLCNVAIGTDFQLKEPDHADDGKLYDPESGKTYKGSMHSDGDTLKLRGYIGIKAFGRSESWTRTTAGSATCGNAAHS